MKISTTDSAMLTYDKSRRVICSPSAFTLIELVVVLLIFGIVVSLLSFNLGTVTYWREQGLIRKLSETIQFLHHQAVVDQAFYRLEFDLEKNTYQVGVIRPEYDELNEDITTLSSDVGLLTLELAAFLSPSPASVSTMIPPPSMPSLAEPVALPQGMRFEDVRTMRGLIRPGDGITPYLLFSPRGFSEFGVIHLRTSTNAPITILINPFSGLAEIHRDYQDFEWSWGSTDKV